MEARVGRPLSRDDAADGGVGGVDVGREEGLEVLADWVVFREEA